MELRARAGLPKGSIYTYNPATNREQSKEELDRLQAEIRPWVQYARDEGYSELYIFAHPDEPGVEEAKAEVASAKAARAVGAKLFTAIGPDIYEEVSADIDLSEVLDLFIVAGPPKAEMAEAIHRKGGRIMCYANPQVGMEEPRTYRRNYGIVLWKAGYDGTMNLAEEDGPPLRVQGRYVTANAFAGLGISPILGRGFLEGDDASVIPSGDNCHCPILGHSPK